VDQPLQGAHLDAIRAGSGDHVVLLLPLVGDRSPVLLSPAALVRTSLAAAEALPGALVIPVPLARRADPADDRALREHVTAAYGGTEVLHLEDVRDAAPADELAAALDRDDDLERFGRTVTLLNGDVVRTMLSAGLTFSRADRDLNVRRTGTSRPRSAGTADWRSAARSPRTPRRARTCAGW